MTRRLTDEELDQIEARSKRGTFGDGLIRESEVSVLIAEIRRLRARYETPPTYCNRDHVNPVPMALWECPTCHEEVVRLARDLVLVLQEMRGWWRVPPESPLAGRLVADQIAAKVDALLRDERIREYLPATWRELWRGERDDA